MQRALPWLRLPVTGLSPWSLGSDPGAADARFTVKKMALGSIFLQELRFYPVTPTPPMPLLILTYTLLLPEGQRANPGSLLKTNACSENRLALYRRNFQAFISRILLVSPDNDSSNRAPLGSLDSYPPGPKLKKKWGCKSEPPKNGGLEPLAKSVSW